MTVTPAATRSPDLGTLPEWDLSDLYPGPESTELQNALARARDDAKAFRDRYRGRLESLSGDDLAAAIAAYEAIEEVLGRVMSFAGLRYAADVADPDRARFNQDMQEAVTDISTQLLFFTLEINRLGDAVMEGKLESPELRHYAPWIRDVRAFRDHQLADDMEELLHEKSVAGRAAWVRLFDETIAALRFPVYDRELTSQEVLNLLTDTDENVRQQAAESIGRVLGVHARTFALITNTLAKDKEIEDRWRHYPRPVSSRNLVNQVEDEVVDALVAATRASYPRLSHRYYALKARWLGKDRLAYWDRNAPLPESEDRLIPWPAAADIVLGAYGAFSGEMADIGRRFFGTGWIDAPVRPGKSPGAFSHSTVPSVHPYILVNYQGKTRDVMTVAHELGHGVHQVLAAPQGLLLADTPLTLAETASVFGEMLTFQALLRATDDAARRRALIAAKVEDMLNTVVRQIAFHEFERKVHDERRAGELSIDRLNEIWFEVQGESLGPAIELDGDYRYYWTYIPHFIHSPFYVYAYAFGDCLVNALYAVYQESESGFADRYLDMLRAGGTKRHRELLEPFGLDAGDPAFWQRGLGVVEQLIDELEALDGAV
ncbi:MAG: M3 family oligoendopeptidase [Alphaproteobacteria bacterium]|nr:M3 family oligoendopeptidase [Alphaproteobacteria bacterium]